MISYVIIRESVLKGIWLSGKQQLPGPPCMRRSPTSLHGKDARDVILLKVGTPYILRDSSSKGPTGPTTRTVRVWDFIANIWVVVKIMVRFWVPIIIRHLIFRVP